MSNGSLKKDSHEREGLRAKAKRELKSGEADPHMEEKTEKRTARASQE